MLLIDSCNPLAKFVLEEMIEENQSRGSFDCVQITEELFDVILIVGLVRVGHDKGLNLEIVTPFNQQNLEKVGRHGHLRLALILRIWLNSED